MIWDIGAIISLVIFMILSIFSFKSIHEINRKKRSLEEHLIPEMNTRINRVEIAGNTNKVYLNNLESNQVIDQYIISYEDDHPYLISHMISPLDEHSVLEICCYNVHKKNVRTFILNPKQTLQTLPVIKLTHDTFYVNLFIHEKGKDIDEDKQFNRDVLSDYVRLAKRVSLTFLFLLIPIGDFMLNVLTGSLVEAYKSRDTLIMGIVLIALTALLSYLITRIWAVMKKRSWGIDQ